MSEFRMPSLGADMESGRLVEWLKSPGTEVERGDIIAVVDTQKGAIEIEVFEDGVLEEILAEPGEEIPVGRTLAYIRAPGEPGREQRVAEKPKPESEVETPHTPATAKPTPSATAYPPSVPGVHMTPAAPPAYRRTSGRSLDLEGRAGRRNRPERGPSDDRRRSNAARSEAQVKGARH